MVRVFKIIYKKGNFFDFVFFLLLFRYYQYEKRIPIALILTISIVVIYNIKYHNIKENRNESTFEEVAILETD